MKRLFDIFFSIFLLVLLSPLLVLIAILVWIFIGRPVLFSQIRPGLNEELFTLVKFRTMTNETDSNGVLLEDVLRLNKFGKFLRSTSLDELPELWNILKGEMSFVGPRPLLVEYLPLYSSQQKERHNVRPGITGWAQINGRNAISWEEKFDLDVWYVGHRTFWLDIRILFMTVSSVIKREGVSAQSHATMPIFKGSKSRNSG